MKFLLDDEEISRLMERLSSSGADLLNVEMMVVNFETDKKRIERIIPKPLIPSTIPYGTAWIAKYRKTSFGSVYNEAALTLGVEFEGEPGSYPLTMPVTEDMACILGREIFGFPKKIADDISLVSTKNGVKGSYVRKKIELMNLSMSFEKEVEIDEFLKTVGASRTRKNGYKGWDTVTYNFKFFLNPDATGFDYKPRLIKQVITLRPISKIKFRSNFELKLRSSDCDHLGDIPVKKPIIGFYGL